MDNPQNKEKKNHSLLTVLLVIVAIIGVGFVVWYITEKDGFSTSQSNSLNSPASSSSRYIGSNRYFEVDIKLNSDSSFSFKLTDLGSLETATLYGNYEFLGVEGKVIKFTFSDGSSCRCSRSIGYNYEFLSINEINSYYPTAYKK